MPDTPIVPDAEFNAALPPISGDINAPLEPMTVRPKPPAPDTDAGTRRRYRRRSPVTNGTPASCRRSTGDTLAPAGPEDPQLAQPLVPLATGFDSAPLETAADIKDKNAPTIRYETVVKGLAGTNLDRPLQVAVGAGGAAMARRRTRPRCPPAPRRTRGWRSGC